MIGIVSVVLRKGEEETLEDVYLHTALLCGPAITKLELVARLDSMD